MNKLILVVIVEVVVVGVVVYHHHFALNLPPLLEVRYVSDVHASPDPNIRACQASNKQIRERMGTSPHLRVKICPPWRYK
jgi:hypothetical protein